MISEAVQDYLKIIYKLQKGTHAVDQVTTSLIAERMEVAAASATNMIKKLATMRLLEHTPYQGVELTRAGEKMALEILRHHRLLELYLADALDYPWDQVHDEAERLEHAISEDFEDRIDAVLGHPTVGAHGEPIPTKQGDIKAFDYTPLADIETGCSVIIRQVSDHNPEMLRYLKEIGLQLGTCLTLEEKAPFGGPLLLQIHDRGHQHIGVEVARYIFVDVIEEKAA